jgi:hypothetical protein
MLRKWKIERVGKYVGTLEFLLNFSVKVKSLEK